MKRLIFGLISISAFTGSIIACSGSSSGSGSSADACASVGNALVAYTEKCQGSLDPANGDAYAGRYAQLCQAELALPGTPSDYASQLSACAAAVQAADCNSSEEQLAACDFNPTGTLANGAACEEDIQCSSGSCSVSSGSTSSSDGGSTSNCGQCQPAIADGASCVNGGTCVSGDTCAFNSADGGFSAICTKKTAPAAVGASCNSGEDCASPNHCAFPTSSGGTGVCTAPGASGATCETTTDCSSGLVCARSGGDAGIGSTCQTPAAEGAACTENQCAIGLACASEKCVKITFGAPGATCDGVAARCTKGTCNVEDTDAGPSSTTCPVILADGQPCDTSIRSATCDDFASCTNGTCVFLPGTCN